MKDVLFFDLETDRDSRIKDIGACYKSSYFHQPDISKFQDFIDSHEVRFFCGHNIFHHDLPILKKHSINKEFFQNFFIDTLYLSALMFPRNPYHKLVKDYKLVTDETNNPVSDCKLTMRLLKDILGQFVKLDPMLQTIYYYLLEEDFRFAGFFRLLMQLQIFRPIYFSHNPPLANWIRKRFEDNLCTHSDFDSLIEEKPHKHQPGHRVELAYTLALLGAEGTDSVLPPWLVYRYPEMLQVLHLLRFHRCKQTDCPYCNSWLDARAALKRIFGFDDFRRFQGDGDIPLQEQVVNASLDGNSLLAIFPTGGGKSLTFQLPALIKNEACRNLTVVISPLQSLMKDQVDVLKERHERTDAVAINGLLSPLERAEAVKQVENGSAGILYISPESLRSSTILRLLQQRRVERFVIDEAHCLSAWGQDFRPDYLYIGKFMDLLAKKKQKHRGSVSIPVSCFTATAKPQVVADIKRYFLDTCGLELEVFSTVPKRENLRFGVYYAEGEQEKFSILLNLITQDDSPKIVYTTRVRRSEELAEKLKERGLNAAAYNGKMASDVKIRIQNGFMAGEIDTIVATSAFGMGIDKEDVSMVIHYNISDSLENYMQEAGRAGRNKEIEANCYILFDDDDLMGHFNLLNISRINRKEIFQVWQGIKKMRQEKFTRSALELARLAGWDAELGGWETRLRTALTALEESGLIKRGQNQTRIYATSLLVKNMAEASAIIQNYGKFDESDRLQATRIIKFIISHKSCPVDFISDTLGIGKYDTRRMLNELKGLRILGDDRDLTAFLDIRPNAETFAKKVLEKHGVMETGFLDWISHGEDVQDKKISLKDINSHFKENNIKSDIESLRTLLFLWESLKFINKKRIDRRSHIYQIYFNKEICEIKRLISRRLQLAGLILEKFLINCDAVERSIMDKEENNNTLVEFSIGELKKHAEKGLYNHDYTVTDYDKTLLYLNHISAIKLDKGLFVHYSPFSITRCSMDNKRQYTTKDYKQFETFYRQKIEQIHIAGEYAEKLSKDYGQAMAFAEDYFKLDYGKFIKRYFPGRKGKISRPITEKRFNEIHQDLSPAQLAVINDNNSKAILVAAGPGSGKTRVLVHKVASLLTLEDIKTEQFLMLTYSRAAAIEMRERLRGLLKKTANYIDIYTFHSFAFSLAEIKGDLEMSAEIIPKAVNMIRSGQTAARVQNKSVLVIDEFQDIGSQEFQLIQAIMETAEGIRILAVGDDDQNIFQFRGSSTAYMKSFEESFKAKIYHLNTNYRSKNNLVQFSNTFIKQLPGRIKVGQILVSSVPDKNGKITVIKYGASKLITPLVKDIVGQYPRMSSGTTAVLTATNDEALLVYSLLREEGINAALLVSYADFKLEAMVELKMFSHLLTCITETSQNKIINQEQWQQAKEQVRKIFSRSKQWELACAVIDSFSREYEDVAAVEWQEYLQEVKIEDFIFPEKDTVFVSTMHKAKGKEFDRVFLVLDNYKMRTDEKRRVVYVAVTRAREELYIHTNGGIFDHILVPGQNRLYDDSEYGPPQRLTLQMTFRDVYLDFFIKDSIIQRVERLQAGDELVFAPNNAHEIRAEGERILLLSTGGAKRIQSFLDKGYVVKSLRVEYIVVWKKKEGEASYRVVLPRIELKRQPNNS